jgi:hypothetical protein
MNQDNTNEAFDAAFRIISDKLDTDQITSLLGIKPDHSHQKGESNNRRSKSGKIIIGPAHRTGIWSISSHLPETSSLEKHLISLLDRLNPVGDRVKLLSSEGYRVDIFCGYFFKQGVQGGFDINPEVLERMGKMGINLAISTNEI